MKINQVTYIILLTLLFTGCTEFFAGPDLQDNWEITEHEKIVLHHRPEGFSGTESPTAEEAATIAANQYFYYQRIQDSIGKEFDDLVLIYLFNKDEAEEHIGTNGGGHSIPKFNAFYYTFLDYQNVFTDNYGIVNPAVGAHEMVHVITHRVLGYPATKLMSEGYANWLDGSYARYYIEDIVKSYRDKSPEKLLTPNQLLVAGDMADSVYCPNSGVFLKYLVSRFGIVKINSLFTVRKENFKKAFENTCNEKWEIMVEEYQKYLDEL